MIQKGKTLGKRAKQLFLACRIAGLITALPVLLKVTKLPTLLRWLTPRHIQPGALEEEAQRVIAYTDRLLGLNWLWFSPSCLTRSLVLYHFLTGFGMPVQVNFGIRKEGPPITLSGHGWLSLKGKTYLEQGDPLPLFKIMYTFPAYWENTR